MTFMTRCKHKSNAMLMAVALICFLPAVKAAASGLKVEVTVIEAGKGTPHIDPSLEDAVKELGTVLNFTRFTLEKRVTLKLPQGGEESVLLPGDRQLRLRYIGKKEEKARLFVQIFKNGKEIFSTTILLVNKGSVIIGGPPYRNGVLLLRIAGEFL